jgi:hypothetical protein
MPKKKRIDALEALLDLRDGMTPPQLKAKYRLSLPELASLLKKLKEVRERYTVSDATLKRLRHHT